MGRLRVVLRRGRPAGDVSSVASRPSRARLGGQALALVPLLAVGAALGPSSSAADGPAPEIRTTPDSAQVQQLGTATGSEPWWRPFVPGLAMAEGESTLSALIALGAGGPTEPGATGLALGEGLSYGDRTGPRVGSTGAAIPPPTLAAYRRAAARLQEADPSCGLEWPLLAGIGRVESNHGRFGGAVVRADGVSAPPVIGIRLDGSLAGTMVVRDSDRGALDGDSLYDRAVGPMQFLPGTWRAYAADGDGDGRDNPQDIDDAALASAAYLCSGSGNLATPAGARAAVLRYNNSSDYADLVLRLAAVYSGLPTTGPIPTGGSSPAGVPVGPAAPQRPASPGAPLGVPTAPSAPRSVVGGVGAGGGGSPSEPVSVQDPAGQEPAAPQPGDSPSPSPTTAPSPAPTATVSWRPGASSTTSSSASTTATTSPTSPTATSTSPPTATTSPSSPSSSTSTSATATTSPTSPTTSPTSLPPCSPEPSAEPSASPTTAEPSAAPSSPEPSLAPSASETPTCQPVDPNDGGSEQAPGSEPAPENTEAASGLGVDPTVFLALGLVGVLQPRTPVTRSGVVPAGGPRSARTGVRRRGKRRA